MCWSISAAAQISLNDQDPLSHDKQLVPISSLLRHAGKHIGPILTPDPQGGIHLETTATRIV